MYSLFSWVNLVLGQIFRAFWTVFFCCDLWSCTGFMALVTNEIKVLDFYPFIYLGGSKSRPWGVAKMVAELQDMLLSVCGFHRSGYTQYHVISFRLSYTQRGWTKLRFSIKAKVLPIYTWASIFHQKNQLAAILILIFLLKCPFLKIPAFLLCGLVLFPFHYFNSFSCLNKKKALFTLDCGKLWEDFHTIVWKFATQMRR